MDTAGKLSKLYIALTQPRRIELVCSQGDAREMIAEAIGRATGSITTH
jgi:hypothetical protein